MKPTQLPNSIYVLTLVAAVLAAVAAGTGIFISNVYRDNSFVRTAWLANDWITLAVALPALAITVVQSLKGSYYARLIWAGLLAYLIYNYAFYLFGAVFNKLFLAYVIIVASGLCSLVLLLVHLPQSSGYTLSKGLRLYILLYLSLISIMLLLVEVPPIIRFLITNKIPELITQTEHPTSMVYALDLTLIVPASFMAVWGLWYRQGWGVVLAIIMLVKGATYGLVLVAGTLLIASKGLAQDPLLPFYALISLGALAGLIGVYRRVNENTRYAAGTGVHPAR